MCEIAQKHLLPNSQILKGKCSFGYACIRQHRNIYIKKTPKYLTNSKIYLASARAAMQSSVTNAVLIVLAPGAISWQSTDSCRKSYSRENI